MDNGISVVIPTYNEKESIRDIIFTIREEVLNLKEIIVVDDNSPDMTWKLVEDMGEQENRIRLIRRLRKRGLAQAIWEGILNSSGDIVMWLDADFSSLPFTIRKFSDSLDDYDVIVASRYVEGGDDKRTERIRVIASRLFNRFARFILRTETKDLTSGYIAARREIFNGINIGGRYGEYCIRFLYQAENKGLRVKEAPYACLSRKKGDSKTSGNALLFIKYGLIYTFTVFKLRLFKKEAYG